MQCLVRFDDYGHECKAMEILHDHLGSKVIIFKKKEYILSGEQIDKLKNNNIRFKTLKTIH
jgi:hypothetical protein